MKLQTTDYDTAIVCFKSILKDYPKSNLLADALYSLGTVYFKKGDFINSHEIFSKFTSEFKDNPLQPQAFYLTGNSLLNLGKINKALSVFKEVPKLYPQDIQLRQQAEYEIADCYYKLGQENEALKQFKFLRTKYPDSKLAPDIMWWLGQYYYRANDLVLARRYLNSLTKDFSDSRLNADAFYVLGLISVAEDKPEEAVENFKKALELGSFDLKAQIQFALAKVYYRLQDYEKAKFYYNESLESTQGLGSGEVHYNLAETLEANLEIDAAIQQYLIAGDLYTQDVHLAVLAFLRAAKLYEDKDKLKEALEVYQKVISKNTPEARFAQERIDGIDSKN